MNRNNSNKGIRKVMTAARMAVIRATATSITTARCTTVITGPATTTNTDENAAAAATTAAATETTAIRALDK